MLVRLIKLSSPTETAFIAEQVRSQQAVACSSRAAAAGCTACSQGTAVQVSGACIGCCCFQATQTAAVLWLNDAVHAVVPAHAGHPRPGRHGDQQGRRLGGLHSGGPTGELVRLLCILTVAFKGSTLVFSMLSVDSLASEACIALGRHMHLTSLAITCFTCCQAAPWAAGHGGQLRQLEHCGPRHGGRCAHVQPPVPTPPLAAAGVCGIRRACRWQGRGKRPRLHEE